MRSDRHTNEAPIEQVMDTAPLTIESNASVGEAITLMSTVIERQQAVWLNRSSEATVAQDSSHSSAAQSHCVVVVDQTHPVGLFTEQTVVRLIALGVELSSTRVADWMQHPIATLTADHSLRSALTLMRQTEIEYLPVVDDQQQLVGLVSQARLWQELEATLNEQVTVAELQLQADALAAHNRLLEQERSRYFDLFEHAPDGYLVTDSQGIIWEANQAAAMLLAVNPSALIGKYLTDFIASSERSTFQAQLNTVRASQSWEVTLKPRRRKGFSAIIAVSPIADGYSQGGLRWLLHDIRDRKQSEQQLQAAHAQLKQTVAERTAAWVVANTELQHEIEDRRQAEAAILELSNALQNAVEGISRLDSEGRYLSVNTAYAAMVGYAPAEMIGMEWSKTVHPDDLAAVQMAYHQMLQDGKVEVEARGLRYDGSVFYKQLVMVTAYNAQGQVNGHYCFMKDVSEQALLSAERQRSDARLKRQLARDQLVVEITQHIRQSLDVNEVLHQTVEQVRQLLNTDRVLIFRFRPDWQGDVIMESVGADWMSILSTTVADPCFRDRYVNPYRQGHVSALNDLYAANLEPCYVELLQHFQVRASLVVPILQGDELWGLLIVHHCSGPRQWQPDELDLLQQLATQVGIAIQQSELYLQTRRELLERQQMQEALEASEERFRSLSSSAPIGICQTNADGICLYTNVRWQEMLGMSFDDCLGNGWMRAIHPRDQDRVMARWEAYLRDEQPFAEEFRFLTPYGKIRWVAAHAAPMRSATGDTIGHVGTAEDITERKSVEEKRERAEAALRRGQQQLQAILDNAPAVIYLVNPDHQILLANRRNAEILATTVDQMIGRSIYDFWPKDAADSYAKTNEQVLATNRLIQLEEIAPQVNGERRYLTIKFPLYDDAGQPYAVCGISTDITEKKQLEEQFYRAQRMESLGTLASGIAHDLNNVFTPILTISQLLRTKMPNLDARSQEMLQLLVDSAKRGANLVKQVLSFSRGTEGNRTPLQVGQVLAEIDTILRQTFPKSIQIRSSIAPDTLRFVSADATQLHQVVMNLCVNARDAMPEGGTLTLSAENRAIDVAYAQMNLDANPGDYVTITVTDTGTGIAPNLLDRIFDPFFTTKETGKGTGLGLSTVLGIVKSHGGFVHVYSEQGKGSQFQVSLPAIEAKAPIRADEESLPRGDGEKILVVDDEAIVQQVIRTLLEDYGYQTMLANDGIEALAVYTQQKYQIDIVLLDIMMPNMDGFAVTRALKKINPQIKIIASSGLPTNRSEAIAAGATTFLSKPYTTEALLKALHELVLQSMS